MDAPQHHNLQELRVVTTDKPFWSAHIDSAIIKQIDTVTKISVRRVPWDMHFRPFQCCSILNWKCNITLCTLSSFNIYRTVGGSITNRIVLLRDSMGRTAVITILLLDGLNSVTFSNEILWNVPIQIIVCMVVISIIIMIMKLPLMACKDRWL